MSEINTSKEINDWHYSFEVDLTTNKITFEIKPKQIIPIPAKIVKYYGLTNHSIDALINNYIYASHPFDLNDPFDCFTSLISYDNIPLDICIRFMSLFGKEEAEVKELYEKDQKQLFSIIEDQFYDYIYSKIGIISMTSDSTNMQMWAYYTGHKGFQIVFKCDSLKNKLHGPFPINYVKESSSIAFSDNGFIASLFQTNIKSSSWVNENEWRFLYESIEPLRLPNRPDLWDKQKERKFKYDTTDIDEIVLAFSFFDHHSVIDYSSGVATYDFTDSKDKDNLIRILDYLISNSEIKVSLIHLVNDLEFKLTKKPILISKIKDYTYSYEIIHQ